MSSLLGGTMRYQEREWISLFDFNSYLNYDLYYRTWLYTSLAYITLLSKDQILVDYTKATWGAK